MVEGVINPPLSDMELFLQAEVLWFVLGAIFLGSELALPGVVLLFFGIGGWVTAILTLLFSPALEWQLLIFALTSLGSLAFLRQLVKERLFGGGTDAGDMMADDLAGRSGTALEDIPENGRGRVSLRGSTWTAFSMSAIKEGEAVIVIEKENLTLHVEPKE